MWKLIYTLIHEHMVNYSAEFFCSIRILIAGFFVWHIWFLGNSGQLYVWVLSWVLKYLSTQVLKDSRVKLKLTY